jgi:hypothetical protein
MKHIKLGKTVTTFVLAVALFVQPACVKAAEDDVVVVDSFEQDDYYYEIEDIDPAEEVVVIDVADEEESAEEASTDEASFEESFDEIIISEETSEELSEEEPLIEDQESASEEDSASIAATTPEQAADKINSVVIKSGIANTAENTKNYGLKFNKNADLKSAVLTLDTSFTTLKISAIQRTKSQAEVRTAPTWQSKNEKVATVTANGLNATVKAVGKGSTTIVCRSTDGSGKRAELKITVKQAATKVEITGSAYGAIGKNISYKAKVFPATANSKKITWSLNKNIEGVKINPTSGRISIKKGVAPEQKIRVRATVNDIKGVYAEKEITIKEAVRKIAITPAGSTTIATRTSGRLKSSVTLVADTGNNESVTWKASNPKKAIVKEEGNRAIITALESGKVTVTATADDGTKKKASIKINIFVPVTSLELTVDPMRLDGYLALGCSLKFTAKVGTGSGKPTNSKVKWDYDVTGFDSKQINEVKLSPEIKQKIKDKKYFYSFKDGLVESADFETADKQAAELYKETKAYQYAIIVKATTTDGTNITVEKLVKRVRKNTYLKLNPESVEIPVGGTNIMPISLISQHGVKDIGVKISDPEVVRREDFMGLDSGTFWIKGNKPGTTKITFYTRDGSGLSATLTVKVR